jgi:hypothetical protein
VQVRTLLLHDGMERLLEVKRHTFWFIGMAQ